MITRQEMADDMGDRVMRRDPVDAMDRGASAEGIRELMVSIRRDPLEFVRWAGFAPSAWQERVLSRLVGVDQAHPDGDHTAIALAYGVANRPDPVAYAMRSVAELLGR
jgi:hypothetical protein